MKPLAAVALAFALLSSWGPSAAATPLLPREALAPVEGEVIVGFKPEAAALRKFALGTRADATAVRSALVQRADALGARLGRPLQAGAGLGGGAQVVRAQGIDALSLARQLAADPDVAYAVPNGRRRAYAAPNDPLYAAAAAGQRPNGPDAGQWYLRAPSAAFPSAIGIEAAWARTLGSPSVVVAVLDTGVRFEHPDLGRVGAGGPLLPGYDFVSNATVANDSDGRDADPSDPGDWVTSAETRTTTFSGCDVASSSWHGTKTASLVGALTGNALGMAGTAPGVRVLPVRVLGKCYGTDSDIQAGMRWAGGIPVDGVPDNPNPARVVNMSLGGEGSCNAAYQTVVNELLARGVTVVAAAGNSAGGPVSVPANCQGVVSVMGLRHVGTKVGFSDLGPEITLGAPGGNCINIRSGSPCLYPILAATNTGSQGPLGFGWSDSFDASVGTSFSSPLVAGVAGLMLSLQPGLTPERLRSTLQATARPYPTSGADNGPDDPTPVTQCQPPVASVSQLQCYCTTALCGAGMLDAGAAVTAVAGPLARVDVGTAAPTAGRVVALSSGGGNNLASYAWTLVNNGGIVTGFDSATNAATATLTPSAAGSFTVRLTVTDLLGNTDTATATVTVAAPPVEVPPTTSGGGGGGGGGAMSSLWVLGVALAAALLAYRQRRSRVTRLG
jgi:serine protease